MASLRGRLERLEGDSRPESDALQESWSRAAVERLTDRQLRLLADALRREEHLKGEKFPQLELSPEEKAALDAYSGYYEEARRGVNQGTAKEA
jgi:hypothetical protein